MVPTKKKYAKTKDNTGPSGSVLATLLTLTASTILPVARLAEKKPRARREAPAAAATTLSQSFRNACRIKIKV